MRPSPDSSAYKSTGIADSGCPSNRNLVLARNFDAGAGTVEQQAVVAAAQAALFHRATRQRQFSVTAAVLQGGDRAIGLPEQHHRSTEKGPCQRLVLQFPGKTGDVPAVGWKRRGRRRDLDDFVGGVHGDVWEYGLRGMGAAVQ